MFNKIKTYFTNRGVTELLFALLMLILPFLPKVIPPVIIALFISAAAEQKLNYGEFRNLLKNPLFWLVVLFGVYLLGMFYTQNTGEGFSTIERKLLFILMPLFFIWYNPKVTNTPFIFYAVRWFIVSITLAALVCIIIAAIYFGYELYCREYRIILNDYPYTNYFFYSYLSRFMHYGYFSLFVNLAIGFQLWLFMYNFNTTSLLKKIKQLFCVLFLSVFVFMLYAKAGMLTLVLLYGITILVVLFQLKNKFISIGLILSIVAIIALFVRYVPETLNRIADVKKALNETETDKNAEESTRIRLLVWSCAWEKVKESPVVGYGTGDAQATLNATYKTNGITVAYHKSLNAHNEFLQSWLEVGILGPVLLLTFLIALLVFAYGSSLLYPISVFVCIAFISFLTESTLRTQNGVLFCCLFAGLLASRAAQPLRTRPD